MTFHRCKRSCDSPRRSGSDAKHCQLPSCPVSYRGKGTPAGHPESRNGRGRGGRVPVTASFRRTGFSRCVNTRRQPKKSTAHGARLSNRNDSVEPNIRDVEQEGSSGHSRRQMSPRHHGEPGSWTCAWRPRLTRAGAWCRCQRRFRGVIRRAGPSPRRLNRGDRPRNPHTARGTVPVPQV